jgi:rhodanese-related sulfurtransferase
LALVAAVVASAALLAGCGSTSAEAPAPAASSQVYAAIIDVRTPAEYTSGHIAGALNIDVESATFDDEIAELTKPGPYLVYCRSGNRSAQAAKKMLDAGFTVADGGGIGDLQSLGYPIGQ